ncbi:MAG: phosphotransferase [Streptosporangiales bacterium]|nr:phosphotransferase [Streptosporangiales bacterium]
MAGPELERSGPYGGHHAAGPARFRSRRRRSRTRCASRLRRYRDGGDATAEAALMTYLAGRGFPVPEVYGADGPDLMLQRLTGPTLLDALRNGAVSVSGGAAVLVDLHDRLHAEPARAATAPAARIVHLDIHPANVLLHHDQAMLIDWRNATEAVPSSIPRSPV